MGAVPFVSSESDFTTRITGQTPVLVDFTASWCGPCQGLAPILDEMSGEYDHSDLQFVKIDADEYTDICERYGVSGLPTLIVFQEGEELMRLGGGSKATLREKLSAII